MWVDIDETEKFLKNKVEQKESFAKAKHLLSQLSQTGSATAKVYY